MKHYTNDHTDHIIVAGKKKHSESGFESNVIRQEAEGESG